MKKLATVFLSATLLSSPVCAASTKVVATYTGGKVTIDQVMKRFKDALDSQPANKGKKFEKLEKKVQESLVRGYLTQTLLDKEAKKLGIRNSKSFKEKLQLAEQQLAQQELIENHVEKAITEKMIDAEYQKLIDGLKGKQEVKASHILVDTEEKAKEIHKKLSKGSKFEDLVKKFTKDEASKENGGELGFYATKGQLVPEFESKVFAMKKNEISEPVKTAFGWHIIKLLDMRDVAPPTKEKARNSIEAKLARLEIQKYVEKLTKDANVELKL